MSKEYIDKEKFNRTLDYSFWLDASAIAPSGKEILKKVRRLLKEEPAADVVERKKGEWIFNPSDAIEMMFTKPKCSECGFESADGGNYCFNCGADMRGKRK